MKQKLVLYSILFVVVLFTSGFTLVGLDNFFDKWDVVRQSPVVFSIKFQTPIYIQSRIKSPIPVSKKKENPKTTPKKVSLIESGVVLAEEHLSDEANPSYDEKKKIINSSDLGALISKIWIKETGEGTNTNPDALHNQCKAQGKTNEFGLGGAGGGICYPTFKRSVADAELTLVNLGVEDNEVNAICTYANGCQTTVNAEGKSICLLDKSGKKQPWQNCSYYQELIKM